ncbi:hypothetical protein D6C83_00890, partial [Aureobasidium pullulans]
MTFKSLLLAYVAGGLTFIPLLALLLGAFAYVAFTKPVTPVSTATTASDVDPAYTAKTIDEIGEKSKEQQNELDTAAAYFAVCREYVPGGINGKPPERSTPAGEVLIAESPSVYQSMYRSIFERGKTQIPTIEGDKRDGKAVKKARNVFYVVLRHGHLMLYDDSEQVEVRHVVSLAHHDIDVYAGGDPVPEGDLWIKRNCIRLTRKPLSGDTAPTSKPFHFFSDNCSEKEDFYHALLHTQSSIINTDPAPLPQKFETADIIKLVQNLHSSDADAHSRWINGIVGRHFYPFGNTPAINLLRDYRPSNSDNVDILALGCGDARNLLFSLWSEYKGNGCKYNFTVCDLNPAVFARNIFLLSAIQTLSLDAGDADYDLLSRLWRIYYHLFITQDDLTFVKQHVSHLQAASGSLEAWLQSPFGSVFHFSSESTLMEIRSFWNSYSELRTTDQDQQVRQSIASLHVGDWHINGRIARVTSHGMRSAGAHSLESVDSMNQALHEFWKTGVVAGNFDDVAMLRRENGGCVNPLISGSPTCPTESAVPYGVEPLIGYHLAEAFSSTQSVPTSMDVLAKLAKSQFFDWCRSFTLCVKSKSVSIMCHTGEAINFAHALQDFRGSPTLPADTHRYTKPWCATQLLLEPTLTSQFDIIDTSNIIDYHGILNVLPAVTPLLKHAPCSILYFESLLQAAEKHESTLETLLHANVTTISLLLGVTPVGHILDTTTDSFESEEIFDRVCPPTTGCLAQLRLRIPFRSAFHGDRESLRDGPCKPFPLLRINPQELASFFKQAYLSMFREAEDTSIRKAVMLRKMNRPLAGDRFFYSRLSLVTLVAAAKRTVQTDWKTCIDALMQSIENDRTLILGSNGMQELYLHFHQTGLWDVPLLRADPRGQMTPYGRTRSRDESGMLGSDDLPAIVHVALIVPRSKLRIFTDRPADQVGTPGLRLTVFNDQLFDDFNFYAIDTFFGRLKEAPAANGEMTIDEDPQGWSGTSDLIVTCAVPTWPLLVGNRKDVCLGLVVNSNASFDT